MLNGSNAVGTNCIFCSNEFCIQSDVPAIACACLVGISVLGFAVHWDLELII